MISLIKGIFAIGSLIVDVVNTVKTIYESLKQFFKENDSVKKEVNASKIIKDSKIINQEITELKKKKVKDGFLSEYELDNISKLKNQLDENFQTLQKSKENESLNNFANSPNNFDSYEITNQTVHILQYHLGQTIFGKKCPKCGNQLLLQFPKDKAIVMLKDFFWGCSGFYLSECKYSSSVTLEDIKLLSKSNIEEFHTDSDTLNKIFSNATVKKGVEARVKKYLNEEHENYFCPIHKVPLVLREKKDFDGALDQFFLGCSLWSNGNCTYVLKIKSAGQLAALLEKNEGKGIL
ncbi:MAG: hypothetical protein KA146_07050 [Leptospiraceae bacterium]|nr:hypothetical protein [Leptospiraceae bacterium]